MLKSIFKKSVLALAFAGTAVIAQAQTPRIAILEGTNARHANEFDLALEQTGWTADRYASHTDSMKQLTERLSDYDMLIATPLFNWGDHPVFPGDDRGAYLEFLKNGGLIVLTDANYEGVCGWAADIDPAFGGLEGHGGCNSSQWGVSGYTYDAKKPHPMRFFPSKITEPNTWGHFESLPEDSKWDVVAYCDEGYPVTVAQSVGKGMIYVTVLRQPSDKQMVNYISNLQLVRAGVNLKSFDMPEPTVGAGTIQMVFSESVKQGDLDIVYEVIDEKRQVMRFEKMVEGDSFELPYYLSVRGSILETLYAKRNGQEVPLFHRSTVLPQLLTLRPNVYRGILSTERRLPEVKFGVELAPDKEQLEGGKIEFSVYDSSGDVVATSEAVLATSDIQLIFRHPVALNNALPAGTYTLKGVLKEANDKMLAEAETTFKILAPRIAQTIIDEDNTFLVNGKPFFPLGIYHITDFPSAASMGLNTVQFWSWSLGRDSYGISRGLAEASAHGLKALVELNHKVGHVAYDTSKSYKDEAAVLMWYSVDEPAEGNHAQAKAMQDGFHAADEQHPVYLLSCRPDIFREQAAFGDVFAMDPYGSPEKVRDWMTNAVESVNNLKPIVCVPSSFGDVTNEEDARVYRSSAYLVLACNGRGIIWYPWSQGGGGPIGVGLKNYPAAQNVVSQICWEVNALVPALVATDRRTFSSEDGTVYGMYTVDRSDHALILVNSTSDAVKVELEIPGEPEMNRTMSDYFKVNKDDIIEIKSGKFEIEIEGYGTRAYR